VSEGNVDNNNANDATGSTTMTHPWAIMEYVGAQSTLLMTTLDDRNRNGTTLGPQNDQGAGRVWLFRASSPSMGLRTRFRPVSRRRNWQSYDSDTSTCIAIVTSTARKSQTSYVRTCWNTNTTYIANDRKTFSGRSRFSKRLHLSRYGQVVKRA
jgi:hypothetical protein